jgi:hypothetical protein
MPNAAAFGVLADPATPYTPSIITDLQAAARTLDRQLVVVNAKTDSDLETAFATFSQQRVGAVLVSTSTFYNGRIEQLAALAARHALPAIYSYREYALAGGLTQLSQLACLHGDFWGVRLRKASLIKGGRSQNVCSVDQVSFHRFGLA